MPKSTNDPAQGMIAAERRRWIYETASKQGSVSVIALAKNLNVAENTIRHDLDILHNEGKLVRSHGGAVVIENSTPTPPYSQTRQSNMTSKALIGAEAIKYIPASGSIFINAGSTTHQMVIRIAKNPSLHVTTNSPESAIYLTVNGVSKVDLIGGEMIMDSLETDGSLANEAVNNLYWETCFLGVSAIDIARGITSINLPIAILEKKIMEHSGNVVVLCDSSKFGKFSRAKAGSVSMIDVLITDNKADDDFIQEITAQGVEVIIARES
ncbi:MAG: DeoR/GlpR family DNA-binding transcription regulator [Armatimonadota bacterium]